MAAEFTPGLRLARSYYDGAVRPVLDECFPGLAHAAALLGPGSEVLGFDGPRSTDHDWGPRLQLFLGEGAANRYADEVTRALARRLPATWRGYPTSFTRTHDPDPTARNRVEVAALGAWLRGWLGFDPRTGVGLTDWLATPTQRLAEITGGAVFHDEAGALTAARAALAWYPDDVWRYVLACQWHRITEEEAFPGRCVEAGDMLGATVITARLVRDVMRLCLLMHRRYPPYGKWLGTAFGRLPALGDLPDHLTGALTAPGWPAREGHLVAAYEAVARMHNGLRLTAPLDVTTARFHDRPYRVLSAGRFAAALLSRVEDPAVRDLPRTGAVDQFVDSTDALGDMEATRAITRATTR